MTPQAAASASSRAISPPCSATAGTLPTLTTLFSDTGLTADDQINTLYFPTTQSPIEMPVMA